MKSEKMLARNIRILSLLMSLLFARSYSYPVGKCSVDGFENANLCNYANGSTLVNQYCQRMNSSYSGQCFGALVQLTDSNNLTANLSKSIGICYTSSAYHNCITKEPDDMNDLLVWTYNAHSQSCYPSYAIDGFFTGGGGGSSSKGKKDDSSGDADDGGDSSSGGGKSKTSGKHSSGKGFIRRVLHI